MIVIFYLITSACCKNIRQIKLQNHNDMMRYLYKQEYENNSSRRAILYFNEQLEKYYCVGAKFNRCQYISQNKIERGNLINETDVNEKIYENDNLSITFYITKTVEIQLDISLIKNKNITFYADPAVNATILLTMSEREETPPEENNPGEDTESPPGGEESPSVIQNSEDINEILIDHIVFHGISLNTDFKNDANFHILELVLEDSALLERYNTNGNLIIDRLCTDFATIVDSNNATQDFFQSIGNLTIDGANSMTTIHFQDNYKFQISNVGSFLDRAYDVYYGLLPKSDYLYFITSRRLDLEADFQMPVAQPQYNKTGVFLTSNYPYIQFSQSNKGLWTAEAQLSIDLFIYEGRRLTLSGNFGKMNTTYYQIVDDWEDSLNLYELNDRDLFPIIASCVATVIVFITLYYLTVGRTIRKYRKLEESKNLATINPDAKPVVTERMKKKALKKKQKK